MVDLVHDVLSDEAHQKALEDYAACQPVSEGMVMPLTPLRLTMLEVGGMSIDLPDGSASTHSMDTVKDHGGNVFHGWVIVVGNDTWVRIQRTTPQGVVNGSWEIEPPVGIDGRKRKISSASFKQFLDGIYVVASAYNLTSGTRTHKGHFFFIPGICVPYPQGTNPDTGVGVMAFIGEGEPEPNPNPDPIDYGEIERRVKFVNDTYTNPHTTLRTKLVIDNIIPKVQYAFINGLDQNNQDPTAVAFRNTFFSYVKNAAANPLQNILQGQDAWGIARQNELKAIVQSAVAAELDKRGITGP